MVRSRSLGDVFGPAAPPRSDLTLALQQRMTALGYGTSAAGVYGSAEDVVVQSYADQAGVSPDDRLNLNAVMSAVFALMDSDIELGQFARRNPGTVTSGDPIYHQSTWKPENYGWLALLGLGLLWFSSRK